jgi:hydroxymethylbilane synthase
MKQTSQIVRRLSEINPSVVFSVVEILTAGDRILDTALSKMPGKGIFVKGIEDQLLAGKIDLAVHSMKDLPTEFPQGLTIGAIPPRVDPRDALVTRLGVDLEELPRGARIGTSSLRRKAQLLHYRPDFEILDIRGNIDTRLRKSETEEYDGTILAAAGLTRMEWHDRVQQFLSCGVMIPAVGQGALGVEVRESDDFVRSLVKPLNDDSTALCVNAERAFLEGMGGGCQTPMGAFCRERNGEITFQAFSANEDGSDFKKDKLEGKLEQALDFAEKLVHVLK